MTADFSPRQTGRHFLRTSKATNPSLERAWLQKKEMGGMKAETQIGLGLDALSSEGEIFIEVRSCRGWPADKQSNPLA